MAAKQSNHARPGLALILRRGAWRVRIEIVLMAVVLLFMGIGVGWLERGLTSPDASAVSRTPLATPAAYATHATVVKYIGTPTWGPRGMTRTDIELACNEDWMTTDEARLLGVLADPKAAYNCKLSADDDAELVEAENQSVAAVFSARANGEMCAPKAISADSIRLACKEGKISSDFARSLGIDARPKSTFLGRYGCELAPSEAQALERDEASVVRAR